MIESVINDVIITPQKIISVEGGDIFHVLKSDDEEFVGFGEAYFSKAEYMAVKAWKRHRTMILNIVVPIGKIRFVIVDDRSEKKCLPHYQEVVLSNDNYSRITIPPMIWMGFQGLDKEGSMLLNIANIPHDPAEADRMDLNEIEFDWS